MPGPLLNEEIQDVENRARIAAGNPAIRNVYTLRSCLRLLAGWPILGREVAAGNPGRNYRSREIFPLDDRRRASVLVETGHLS
jgi:hypothetical protein